MPRRVFRSLSATVPAPAPTRGPSAASAPTALPRAGKRLWRRCRWTRARGASAALAPTLVLQAGRVIWHQLLECLKWPLAQNGPFSIKYSYVYIYSIGIYLQQAALLCEIYSKV